MEYENKRTGYSGLSEEDLENVAGGNAATAILGCGFLALMGFLGGMTSNNNTASAEFVPFSQTSEAKQLVRKEARDPTIKLIKRYLKEDIEEFVLNYLIGCQNKVISSQEKLIEYIENYNPEKFNKNLSSLIEEIKNSQLEQFNENLSKLIEYIKNSEPEMVNENLSKAIEEIQTSQPENFNENLPKLEEIKNSHSEKFSENLSKLIESLKDQEDILERAIKKRFGQEKRIKQRLVQNLEESDLSSNNPTAFAKIKDIINKFEIDKDTFNEKYSEISIDANNKTKIDEIKSKMENISSKLKENDPEIFSKIEGQTSKCHDSLERALKLINFIRSEIKSAQQKIAEVQAQVINDQTNDTNPPSLPFYLQADHLVDGILWFKDPDTDKVFFILDRSVEDGESKYTCPYYKEIIADENRLFDFKDLPEILKGSYKKAEEHIEPNDTSTLQLIDDNPVYNFARFYNSNYKFDAVSNREQLSVIPMYASSKNQSGNLFETIDWDKSIKNSETKLNYAEQLSDNLLKQSNSWEIAHRKQRLKPPKIIESHKIERSTHTYDKDADILRNTGFVFFTLQPQSNERNVPSGIFNSGTLHEFRMPFKDDIPLVSCSLDMLGNLETDDPNELDVFPSFNGTAEEVKEQIIKYYVNEKVKDLEEKDCNEINSSKNINEIIEQIKNDNLEVRIPSKVIADNWESFEYKEP